MSGSKSNIVSKVKTYVETALNEKLPEGMEYHSVEHTKNVVSAAIEIGVNSGLKADELEILELAAWFHDIGFTEAKDNHEEKGAEIARELLLKEGYDPKKTEKVAGCILATKMPQNPKNELEQMLCDADLIHLAADHYFDTADRLKEELRQINHKEITDKEWLKKNKEFIKQHEFFTPYAKQMYEEKTRQNLKQVKKKLKKMKKKEAKVEELESQVTKLKEKVKKAKEITPTRGIETMFRLTSKNHLDLSAMADTKANIMISVNSIILSVLVSVLFRKLEEYPHLIVPAIIMTLVCLSTIVFAILATRPNVSKGTFTEEDILSKRTNLLFFGNFHKMKMEEYEWGMKEMMKDADYLYTSLIRDIYFLGVVLGKKYRLLRVSYTIFMFGFVIAVLSFMIAEVYFKQPAPY